MKVLPLKTAQFKDGKSWTGGYYTRQRGGAPVIDSAGRVGRSLGDNAKNALSKTEMSQKRNEPSNQVTRQGRAANGA